MIRLNDSMRQREEHWIGQQVKGIKNPEEKSEFLQACADFILYVDNYCTGEAYNRFSKEKKE